MHEYESVRHGHAADGIVAVAVHRLDFDAVKAFAGGAHRDSQMIESHVNRERHDVGCDGLLSDGPESVEKHDAVYVVVVQKNPRLLGIIDAAKVNLDPIRRESDLLRQCRRRNTALGLPRPCRRPVYPCHQPPDPKKSFPTPEGTRDDEPQAVVKPRNARVGDLVFATDEGLQIAVRHPSLEVADSPPGERGELQTGQESVRERAGVNNIDARPCEVAQKANIPTSDDSPSAPAG